MGVADFDILTAAGEHKPTGLELLETKVATTASDPGDDVFVIDPLEDPAGPRLGPCPWAPRPGPAYPQRGDTALIAMSNTGRWWILAWEPAS